MTAGKRKWRRALAGALCTLFAVAALTQVVASAASPPNPNPLAIKPAPPATDPLVGAQWFVDRNDDAQRQLRAWRRSGQTVEANLLAKLADEPQTVHFGFQSHPITASVRYYLRRVRRGTVATFSTYDIPHLGCTHTSDTPAQAGAVRAWMKGFARGIGKHRIVVFLEEDALITIGCLSHSGLAVRMSELEYATRVLGALPHTVTYLDAGAADGDPSPGRMASLLRRAGIRHIRGFFLNASHYDWTSNELRYGDRVAKILHTHFVVSTTSNGRGPLRPHNRGKNGNEILCNPPGRGLGPRPTTTTNDPYADAFMWIGIPGRSNGQCHPGDPPGATWFPAYALALARNANGRLGPGSPSQPY
ncbi:MAG TPA: glycoside hydrolase family 6 protein [Solirubrobacteraceae bacterium]|jgi:endoglucanase|nr:glycoside hydrolase family 6 protein [Solirubrobacteraceae bacterium]